MSAQPNEFPDATRVVASPKTDPLRPELVPPAAKAKSVTRAVPPQVDQTAPPPDGRPDSRSHPAAGSQTGEGPSATEVPTTIVRPLADPLLALLADSLDDLERTRIAAENRLRQLTRTEVDSDGVERGFGLDTSQPQVANVAALVDALKALEHGATLNLQRRLRQHPLGPWVKRTVGVGEKQGARLLAAIGDPAWNTLHNRPRTVSELWAYAGYHVLPLGHLISAPQASSADRDQLPADQSGHGAQRATVGGNQADPGHEVRDAQTGSAGVAPSRRRGVRANWSATAKMRAFLVAESCIKQAASPYRAVYEAGRAKYAESTHNNPCPRCGPAGKPAPVGSPLSKGHQHARAMRLVSKEILKDLWREARAVHGWTS